MFHWTMTARGCRKYRARIEDCLKNDVQFPSEPPSRDVLLEAHLSGCKRCRAALEDARLAHELVRNGSAPLAVAPYGFERRVMAAISEETARRMGMGIWRPLELLASRFALVAAAVLLALSVYLAEFAPPFRAPAASAPAITSQAELGAGLPEPAPQPSNEDEVLTSLAETANGI